MAFADRCFHNFAELKMLILLKEVQMKKMGKYQRESSLKTSTAGTKKRNTNTEASTRNTNILQKKTRTKNINTGTSIRNINGKRLLMPLIKKMDQQKELKLIF